MHTQLHKHKNAPCECGLNSQPESIRKSSALTVVFKLTLFRSSAYFFFVLLFLCTTRLFTQLSMQRTTKRKWLISLFVAPQSQKKRKEKNWKTWRIWIFDWLSLARYFLPASQSCGARGKRREEREKKESLRTVVRSKLKYFCTIIIRPDMKMVFRETLFSGKSRFRSLHPSTDYCSSLFSFLFGSQLVFLFYLLHKTRNA